MKEVIKIQGGQRLNGTLRVSGAKNATVALIPAAVLGNGKTTLYGIPDISDVDCLIDILKYLDIDVLNPSQDEITIDTTNMHNKPIVIDAVKKLRASYYFMGALLGKYREVSILVPGGCNLGPRPIDLHLKGFQALGANVEYHNEIYHITAKELIGTSFYLDITSVGATINIMMAAVYAKGKTVIKNAAREPEVIDVATMLNNMGALVQGAGTSTITIEGVDHLQSCIHEIIPDRIEAGTFIIMAAAMADHVRIENIIPYHLETLISKLKEMGANIDVDIDSIDIYKSLDFKAISLKTAPFPGFATDLQAPLAALLTQATGNSTITETIYPDRFKHCDELNKMGANIIVNKPTSIIVGKTNLTGTKVSATDLRCGGALVVAGLIADGITTIDNIYHIDRGYENLDGKLKEIGAKIWREFED